MYMTLKALKGKEARTLGIGAEVGKDIFLWVRTGTRTAAQGFGS
jgi:hypothetical protein